MMKSVSGIHGLWCIPVLLLVLMNTSCENETSRPEIPDVLVSFVIDPNSTTYLELNHPGGWAYLTGGYN